jgi:hypothetical protein
MFKRQTQEQLIGKICPWCCWEVTDFEPMLIMENQLWHQECWDSYLRNKPIETGSM